jgi:hypothetical protein
MDISVLPIHILKLRNWNYGPVGIIVTLLSGMEIRANISKDGERNIS